MIKARAFPHPFIDRENDDAARSGDPHKFVYPLGPDVAVSENADAHGTRVYVIFNRKPLFGIRLKQFSVPSCSGNFEHVFTEVGAIEILISRLNQMHAD